MLDLKRKIQYCKSVYILMLRPFLKSSIFAINSLWKKTLEILLCRIATWSRWYDCGDHDD